MKEGRFLKFPGKKESKTFVRKKKEVPSEKFEEIISSWEENAAREKEEELPSLFKNYEVEKTSEQVAVLNFVLEGAKKLSMKYGVEPEYLDVRDIHILKDEFWQKIGQDDSDGMSFPVSSAIGIKFKEGMTNLHLASIAFHELVHQKSFAQVSCGGTNEEGWPDFALERSAFSVINSSGDAFDLEGLNEALTTELSSNFTEENREHPFFKEDFKEMDELYSKEEQKGADYMISRLREDGETTYHLARGYVEARENMKSMFEDVLEKNPEKFSAKEEVFDFFVEAYFKGNLLGISRLLKSTYGKDKTIKEIAKEQGL